MSLFQQACIDALAALLDVDIPDRMRVSIATRILEEALESLGEMPATTPFADPSRLVHNSFSSEYEVVENRDRPIDGYHQIPVPKSWSVEQAWEAICRGDGLPPELVGWAVVEVRDGRFVKVVPLPPHPDE